MDFNRKLDKILQEIREIENYTADFRDTGSIPKVEMDILTEKVRHLYDELVNIDRNYPYHTIDQSERRSVEPQQAQQTQPATGKKKESNKVQKNTYPGKSEKKEQPAGEEEPGEKKETQTPDKKTRDSETQYKDQPLEESKTVKQPKQEKNDIPEILADKYYNSTTSMHENLASKQSQKDLSSKMQSKPIRDLGKAIGLNDRYLFIRELFDGDKDAYYEAIQILNEMPGYEEAEEYIRQRFGWDEEQPEVVKFMDLVRRKFVSEE
jgi:hypothetical protein